LLLYAMSVIKQINDESSTIAWSPVKSMTNVIATGTMEGGGGGFDEYGGALSLHRFDPANPTMGCTKLNSFKTTARFSSLAWGRAGTSSGRPYGLIAGGLSDGVVQVYDPSKVIQGTDGALVTTINNHSGAIKSVDFNPNAGSHHLFAAGSRYVHCIRARWSSTALCHCKLHAIPEAS
jgi:protein transport protein SEC31